MKFTKVRNTVRPLEKCVFCGWSRQNTCSSVRFFNIPKEPGLKKVRWLHSFANRKVSHRDRVCSVHFRSGRPSNDPSHEDFFPHLNLNAVPTNDVVRLLNDLTSENATCVKILNADACVEASGIVKIECIDPNSTSLSLLPLLPTSSGKVPLILQRHRQGIKEEVLSSEDDDVHYENRPFIRKTEVVEYPESSISSASSRASSIQPKFEHFQKIKIGNRTRKAIPLGRCFVNATGIQAGQMISIKCKKTPPAYTASHSPCSSITEQKPQSSSVPSQQYYYNRVAQFPFPERKTDYSGGSEQMYQTIDYSMTEAIQPSTANNNYFDGMPQLTERMNPHPEQFYLQQQQHFQQFMNEQNSTIPEQQIINETSQVDPYSEFDLDDILQLDEHERFNLNFETFDNVFNNEDESMFQEYFNGYVPQPTDL